MSMKRLISALLAGCCALSLCGCTLFQSTDSVTQPQNPSELRHRTVEKIPAEEGKLVDNASLYSENTDLEPVCFYVTVVGGNAADETDHSWSEVNEYLNLQGMQNVEKILTEVILQIGDEDGPREGEIGFNSVSSNATINVRGRTSTGYSQKSYRIDLFDDAGLWRGQRAIALNKHPADTTRLRNKLYFELLQDVPSIPSLRTQFVHLYVRDLTVPEPETAFSDYGLYTQVELPNNRYLRNHAFSINGNLYKANMFEMFRYPDALKLVTDPGYDEVAFEAVLETKTGNDHTKLLRMLDAVNDYSIPAEELLETYFDIDNLTSFLAFNILLGNQDSNAQNYLLYSPLDSERWYYFCWDGDDCLNYSEYQILGDEWDLGSWSRGVSNYWGVVLFNRLLRLQSFRDALAEKMESLHQSITPERVRELISEYRTVVDRYTNSLPDRPFMKATAAQREEIYASMPGDVEVGYQHFLESMEKPMPFFQGDVESDGESLIFRWDPSYDFDGEFLRYDVQICEDWSFENPLWTCEDELATSVKAPMLQPGDYYWRVTVHNESGFNQSSFDSIITNSGSHNGMRRFTVLDDGTVVNPL